MDTPCTCAADNPGSNTDAREVNIAVNKGRCVVLWYHVAGTMARLDKMRGSVHQKYMGDVLLVIGPGMI